MYSLFSCLKITIMHPADQFALIILNVTMGCVARSNRMEMQACNYISPTRRSQIEWKINQR